MFNSYKPVAQILGETPSVNTFLQDAEKYYAHIHKRKAPEFLNQHIELVQEKFLLLCNYHQLDLVIDRLVYNFVSNNFESKNSQETGNFFKKVFVNTIVFHDFGKINENFQAHPDKMNNSFFKGKEIENSAISTHHSALGAYLFIVKHFQEFYNNKQYLQAEHLPLSLYVLALSYPIFKHHGKYLQDKISDKVIFSEKEIDIMKTYIDKYHFQILDAISQKVPAHTSNVFQRVKTEKISFSLYNLVRLSFSLLTASDYLATGEYMNDLKLTEAKDIGILSRDRIEQIINNIENKDYLDENEKKENYNKKTYQALPDFQFKRPQLPSNDNLNVLRQEMAVEVIQNIRKNSSKNLFYIEAPTGGGKTNLSMLATMELFKANPELNKVFYVFPFTTLITQTYASMKETLGLHDDEIIQLHSKAGFKSKDSHNVEQDLEEKKDGRYGEEKKNYIDNLFVNFPFCLLSHIKFFDILKTNEKETNYLLHRLANSVVVIDELQSYNPSHWDKVIYFIRNYAEFFNIRFILMSATLPKLSKLKVIENQVNDFVYLLPNAKENYFQNANFRQRVEFNFSLLQEKNVTLNRLAETLITKSKEYALKDFGEAKPQDSIYTIIEFIYKKSATEFYQTIQPQNDFFDEIFVLSGTILEHRRKYIINYLKNSENRKKRILLITTQVVEAGVDIDMDLGFKNKSLIDSDEQLAGRINRNVNKRNCELYLFNKDESGVLYSKDKRYQESKKLDKEYEDILITKDFDRLYNLVLDGIEKWNNTNFAINFSDYEHNIKKLNFRSVHDQFKLIDQENLSVFVPLAIPLEVDGTTPGTKDKIFSEGELEFLKKAGILPSAENKVKGDQVFELYADLINNKKPDFIQKKVNMKTLQGIISKFVFSIFGSKKTKAKLIYYSDIEIFKIKHDYEQGDGLIFGFVYLSHYEDIYKEKFGLDDSKFDATENCIL